MSTFQVKCLREFVGLADQPDLDLCRKPGVISLLGYAFKVYIGIKLCFNTLKVMFGGF